MQAELLEMNSKDITSAPSGKLSNHFGSTQPSLQFTESQESQVTTERSVDHLISHGFLHEAAGASTVSKQAAPQHGDGQNLDSFEKPSTTIPPSPQTPNGNSDPHIKSYTSSASPPTPRTSSSPDYGGTKKRTASGTVKLQKNAPPGDHSLSAQSSYVHSRNASLNSTTSTIGELSFNLKTRLTHAMAKVQNERESYHAPTSPVTSPASISTVLHGVGQQFQPVRSSTTKPDQNAPYPALETDHQSHRGATGQPSSAYRSTPFATHRESNERRPPYQGTPSLAPAPEIIPSSSSSSIYSARRTNGLNAKPPTLNTSRPSVTPNSSTPVQNNHPPSTPTPQEQDAVDTLLFMSSPANSANFPRNSNTSSQASPRRSHMMSSSREAFRSAIANGAASPPLRTQESISSSSELDSQPSSQRDTKRRSLAFNLKTEKDVDHLLDQMAEDRGADEDDQAEITPLTPYARSSIAHA